MTSNINPTYPQEGSATTASVRQNFYYAKQEIEALQSGGGFGPQTANTVLAGPTTGSAVAPAFRALVDADLPGGVTGSGAVVKASGPTVTGGSFTGITTFGVLSSGTGPYDLRIANTENLTTNRTLTITLNNAARKIGRAHV